MQGLVIFVIQLRDELHPVLAACSWLDQKAGQFPRGGATDSAGMDQSRARSNARSDVEVTTDPLGITSGIHGDGTGGSLRSAGT